VVGLQKQPTYMHKDFDMWNIEKKKIDKNYRHLEFREKEIWWCSFGVNVGEEVYGKGINFRRPVIILRKLSKNSAIVVPTTTKHHNGSWYFEFISNYKLRWAMMNQIKFISGNRLYVKESEMKLSDFVILKKSIAYLLGLHMVTEPKLGSSGCPKCN
jgi:mRNA interferase MazF